jgi:hypothetical protein
MRSASGPNRVLKKETPHLFMWFTNGFELETGMSVLPDTHQLDYKKRLFEEYEKLQKTNTPLYFVYMGNMLSEEQKLEMASLAEGRPGLVTIDYDVFAAALPEDAKTIIAQVIKLKDRFLEYGNQKGTTCGIGDLVDYTRLVLLYYCDILHSIACVSPDANGLVYRDFDVVLKADHVEDIALKYGLTCSSTLTNTIDRHIYYLKYISDLTRSDKVKDFLSVDNLMQCFELYSKTDEELQSEGLLEQKQQQDTLCTELFGNSFRRVFLDKIQVENSLIAVSESRFGAIRDILDSLISNMNPYGAFQQALFKLADTKGIQCKSSVFQESLRYEKSFAVGNDKTWTMDVSQLHDSKIINPDGAAEEKGQGRELAEPAAEENPAGNFYENSFFPITIIENVHNFYNQTFVNNIIKNEPDPEKQRK